MTSTPSLTAASALRFVQVRRDERRAAPRAQRKLEGAARLGVVLEHEDANPGDVGDGGRLLAARRARCLEHGTWQRDGESAAAAGAESSSDAVAEELHQALHDRQPEAEALGPVAPGVLQLIELLEHARLLALGNAGARIAHANENVAARALAREA